MTPIGIKLALSGQQEVSQGLKQVNGEVAALGNAGSKLGGLSQGMDKATVSAGQLKMATQQLPMQFQDIVVSLQAGQQPLTVLLQQGSQLAGSFDGAGAAAKAMAGYVVGLVNPLTVAGVAIAGIGLAMASVEKTLRADTAWQAYADATRRGVDLSVEAMKRLRGEMTQLPGVSKSMATSVLGDLVGFRDLSTKAFGDIALMAADVAVLMRTDMPTAAKKLAEAMSDPAKGAAELNESLRVLSAQQVATAQAMAESGDKAGAQAYVLEQVKRAAQGLASEGLTPLQKASNDFGNAWSDAMQRMDDNGVFAKANQGLAGLVIKTSELVTWLSKVDIPPAVRWLNNLNPVGRAVNAAADFFVDAGADKSQLPKVQPLPDGTYVTTGAQLKQSAPTGQLEWDRDTESLLKATAGYKSTAQAMAELREQADKLQQKLQDLRGRGEGDSELAKKLQTSLDGVNDRLVTMGKSANAGAKATQSAYQDLMSTINQKIAAMQSEVATGEKLTETEKLRAKLKEELDTKDRKYSDQQRANLEARLQELNAAEQQAIAARDLAEANEQDAKVLEKVTQQRERSLQAVQQQVIAAQDEERAAAMAAASNISAAEAMALLARARAEDVYQQAVANDEAPQTLYFLEKEMQARRQLAEVMGQRTVREANKKAADQVAKDWERISKTVGDTLADYIMAGGKDGAQYLKRLFATLVLQPVVQPVVGGIMGTGMAGASGVASGGVGGIAGIAQNVNSIYGALSGSLTYGLGSAAASIGAAIGSTAATSFGAGMAASGFTANAFATGASMIGSGATAGGLGMMAGAALPWVAGAAALYSIIKGFDNSGTPHMGAGAIYKGGRLQEGSGIYNRGNFGQGQASEWSAGSQSAVSSIAGALGGALDGFAKAFGQKAGYTVATAFADDSSSDGAWGSLRIADADGNVLVDWERSRSSKWAPKIFADGDAGYKQYLAAVAVDVKQAFLAMDLPGWADEVLATAKDIDTLSAAIQQIGTIKTVFDGLGQSMAMFKDLSGAAQTKLLQVSGSVDTLASNAQSFYANYYSEQERLDATVAGLTATFAKYGAALPATAEQYRTLVEQQMAAGEAGAEFAAVLLGLNGTFKQVADVWKTELDGMREYVSGFFGDLKSSITALSVDVADSRSSILRGNSVMSAAELQQGIVRAMVAAPSMTGLASAQAAAAAAAARVNEATQPASAASAAKQSAQSSVASTQQAISKLDAWFAGVQKSFDSFTAYRDWAWSGAGTYSESKALVPENQRRTAQYQADLASYTAQRKAAVEQLRLQQAALSAASDQAGVYAQKLADAQSALAAAQKAELQAQVDYASQVQQFVIDAGGSVDKLSALRGDVVSFYEAQAQAVQTMLQSAGNVRGVVEQLRMGQLSTAQTAAELGSRYATDYSMALATTGTVRAEYVNSMAANLGGLTQALKAEAATSEDWRIQTAKLFAQATTAAGLLEGDAKASNYQDVALGLLDSIDGALSSLGIATKSAEQVIADAVNNGTQSQLAGLRAIVAALKGEAVPAFATGGFHAGGLRLVGERGPELEVTGPARYWSADQTAAILGGGGGAMAPEIRALRQEMQLMRQENQAHALALLDQGERKERLLDRWDREGQPEQRPDSWMQA